MIYKPLKTVFLYVVVGLLWILLSDRFLALMSGGVSVETYNFLQNIKGAFFVFSTATLLYFLLHKQQKELIVSEKQYRNLFKENPNPMWIYDFDTYAFIEVNEAAIEKYGFSRDEFLTMNILDIRPQRERELVIDFINQVKKGEAKAIEVTHLKKSGEELVVAIKTHSVKFNKQLCGLVLAIDITDRVNQQKRLEEAYKKEIELNEALAEYINLTKKSDAENKRFAQIISKISNVVLIVDKGGAIVWVNQAFTQITGYSFQEASGTLPHELCRGELTDVDKVEKYLEAVKLNPNHPGIELVYYTKDKEEYWVELTMTPIFDESGAYEGAIGVENVITERKQREQKIQEQNQVLRNIAWVSSHEIRRPVCSILSLVNLLKTLDDAGEKQECLQLLEKSSQELDSIVKEIAHKVNYTEI